jgi:hypothetical protein
MYMDPGFELTPSEGAWVVAGVLRFLLVREAVTSPEGKQYSMRSDTFLHSLGWPQRRLPDVRGFLESRRGRSELSEAAQAHVKDVMMSRSTVYVTIG